ncbi:hypothetical protein BGX27_002674 [Mortierella sp. AM989]|nr:hypothetical protein BGX27_002674 [Mortierella sp. AM989]
MAMESILKLIKNETGPNDLALRKMGVVDYLKKIGKTPDGLVTAIRESRNTGNPTREEIRDIEAIIRDCIKENNLGTIYDNARVSKVVDRVKGTNFETISKNWNGVDIQLARELCKLALYDIILLVDNSASIFSGTDGRHEELIMVSSVISEVASLFDDDGIEIVFLHGDASFGVKDGKEARKIIGSMDEGGDTQLGRTLRDEIHSPFRRSCLQQIEKPVLIYIITDGEPCGEPRDELEKVVKEGRDYLVERGYPENFFSYQIAQVGNDTKATEFLNVLDNNASLGAFIDVTSRYEIEELQFRGHGAILTPEIWLIKLLLGAIDESFDRIAVVTQTKSGKSTLVETIRQYANPNHTIDKYKTRKGSTTYTKEVARTLVNSYLPNFNVTEERIACNVLLIGETQAGKSTFVEAIRQYTDPNHTIDKTKIGKGTVSFTKEVSCTRVNTDLPSYNVIEKPKDDPSSSKVINTDALMDEETDWEDYEERINGRKGLTLERVTLNSGTLYQFDLFDTPGLNDTNGEDEVHINTIFQALKRLDKIDLVLVMVGPNPFTPGFRTALKCYIDVFPEFQGVIAFVHTKVDYIDLHPQRKNFHGKFEEKKGLLHGIMGRSNCQHFVIDCDFESTKPIRTSITLNTIRRILSLAPYNEPVTINKHSLHKTPKMMDMDRIIVNKYSAMIKAIVVTLSTKDVSQGKILQKVYELKTKLNTLQAEKRDGEEFIAEYDTQELVMIHEGRFDEQWRLFHINRPHHMSFPDQIHTISKVALLQEATEVLTQEGGENDTFWEIEFKRKSFQDGVLHAKLYTTSADKYRSNISEKKTRVVCLQAEIPEAEEELSKHNETHASQQQEIDELVEENRRYTELLSLAKKDKLDPNVFEQLVKQKAYTGEAAENAIRVENMYLQAVK